jgi:hypothetical protein
MHASPRTNHSEQAPCTSPNIHSHIHAYMHILATVKVMPSSCAYNKTLEVNSRWGQLGNIQGHGTFCLTYVCTHVYVASIPSQMTVRIHLFHAHIYTRTRIFSHKWQSDNTPYPCTICNKLWAVHENRVHQHKIEHRELAAYQLLLPLLDLLYKKARKFKCQLLIKAGTQCFNRSRLGALPQQTTWWGIHAPTHACIALQQLQNAYTRSQARKKTSTRIHRLAAITVSINLAHKKNMNKHKHASPHSNHSEHTPCSCAHSHTYIHHLTAIPVNIHLTHTHTNKHMHA